MMTPNNYFKAIKKTVLLGSATEHTHHPALKSFIESFDTSITTTNKPKHVKCGAPDFVVTRGEIPLGDSETKDVGEPVEKSEQMSHYLENLSNLILTDYREFRWH